ncbi:SET domain bifurcated histone lysine methyltransferase eggless isoform X2 [Nomia melanderi]|nr:histone-lysine N-methyltransferase eggless isoform X3 [Nomia melanderi]XP_031841419.1 histone-lysine N-methyltransferase eggless isoform X3 [Nomia melanderi]XP_031841420.1 histone-lysine N-methyltransferase eggless isoform X3 [Nomia melanderi]XP_031841421.1 histone-lysine N-methyltransferase eggless isoform X3 [Nomia melanderi]XP_031841422.1 histone-lysine N-methyltransferase eggless isoform X3 [Nomia melanderi]XP_031841423.1 histone-lysine N-methyltransferase eggless isoform X3 [Nomia mela
MEVIELVSDEEAAEDSTKKNKSPKICNSNCINFQCSSGVEMRSAPSFACAFYGVNTEKKKKRLICKKCFNAALDHQKQLVSAFVDHKPLLKCEFPDHTMEVEISDSDESDDEKKNDICDEDKYLPKEMLESVEEMLDSTLKNIIEKYDVDYQIKESHDILKKQWDKINEEKEVLDKTVKDLMRTMDTLRNNLYNEYRPQIQMLQELQIDDGISDNALYPLVATKKVTQVRVPPAILQDSQPEILPIEQDNKQILALDLPPTGPLVKPQVEIDSIVYIMKHPLMPWNKAKVHTIVSRIPLHCRVKLLQKKYNSIVKSVPGKQLAPAVTSQVIIPVGTRVVAVFRDVTSSNFYSGVIAEPPKATNKYRYLIFFDDGYAQYVEHNHIYLVAESSSKVWEDIPNESREFVKKYIETYPERPMVKLQTGQVVKTEWNGKWWIARVVQVDASLVQMHFDADGRTEWIYRGSARLGPLYLELLKANARQQGHHASVNTPTRHRLPAITNKSNLPYVEYTSNVEPEEDRISQAEKAQSVTVNENISVTTPSAPQQARAVARKSTTKKQNVVDTNAYNPSTETKPSHSIVYYQTQNKIQTKKFVPHKCGPQCVQGISFTPDDLRGYSPLSIPLLCGWNRQLCKYPKGKKITLYQAPCGIRLRNMEELHQYLRKTGSPMSVDLFDFDHWVHCLAEFVLDKCFINIKDLSYGVENVPIPCVNELDHTQPDTISYSTKREPTEGVNLNLDPNFLCSCDCEDDCQDKTKCQCWQLTIQGATLGGRVPNTSVGYVYKRLPEPVTTGIYECNSGCKCAVKTCLNRVVQHPLTLKLQVFKTAPRGWGIRCLNDIPLGSFVCIYAGRLLTEQGANEGGKNYGDEYLAELDYVEVVEGIKEGYESDVLEPEMPISTPEDKKKSMTSDDEDYTRANTNDSDEDFDISKYANFNVVRSDPSSIRKRLRKRKREEITILDESEENSEDGVITKNSETLSKPSASENRSNDQEAITISDEEENRIGRREPSRFDPTVEPAQLERPKFKSVRDFFGEDEAVYIMDAKTTGNIGRYLNHSCDPNVFVQNVFVDTHDVRFPWVAFFALNYIRAGQELTWNYSYDVGSIPGKVIICKCGASNCRGRLL